MANVRILKDKGHGKYSNGMIFYCYNCPKEMIFGFDKIVSKVSKKKNYHIRYYCLDCAKVLNII